MERPQLQYNAKPGRAHQTFDGIGVSLITDIMSYAISLEAYAVGAWSGKRGAKSPDGYADEGDDS